MALLDGLVPRSRRARTARRCAGCAAQIALSAETYRYEGYEVHRCGACGSLVTEPLPTAEELREAYAHYNDEYTGGMSAVRYEREMPKRFYARLDILQRLGAQGRLIDLGGSNGMFGRLANARGFRVDIADFISEPRDLGFAIARPADLSTRRDAPFEDAIFDVVTSWSCIEHVRDPEACLSEAFRLTRPGGLLALDTPLVGDLCERLFDARSHWICPPQHLHLYSERGLALAVERAGFEVIYRAPFFERTAARWLARRGRNVAVAAKGFVVRAVAPDRWARHRDDVDTAAGDIQFLIARRPLER